MDPDRIYNRQPLDPWKRCLTKDMIQPSDEAFTLEAIGSYHWKLTFPPSIRVQNIIQIAASLQTSPRVRYQDPTGLKQADSAEYWFYSSSSSSYEYLTWVRGYLREIRHDSQESGGEETVIPDWYYLTQPVSDRFVIVQMCGMASEISKTKLVERQPGNSTGPIQSLLQRQDCVRSFVEKILSTFLSKFKIPVDMKRVGVESKNIATVRCPLVRMANVLSGIPLETACVTLSSSLQIVRTEMEELVKEPQSFDTKSKYLEDLYASTVMQALKKFVKDVAEIDIMKFACRKQFMSIQGPELLKHVMMEHRRQVTDQLGKYYRELIDAQDASKQVRDQLEKYFKELTNVQDANQ